MAIKRFSPRRSFNKTSINKVPINKPGIYKIMNLKGENIYSGSAKLNRLGERLEEHLPGGSDAIKGAKTFQIKQFNSILQAQKEEKKIIKNEKPKFNR